MDASGFDHLAKSLSTPGTRRRLVRLLVAVPVAGSLLALLESEGLAANGHQGHKGGKGHNGGKGGKGGKGGNAKGRKGKHRSHTSRTWTPSNPCAGQPDSTCCAGATGGQWCQGKKCRDVPTSGTITECRGACGVSGPRPVTVCGATMTCPECTECPSPCQVCSEDVEGPWDTGSYCLEVIGNH